MDLPMRWFVPLVSCGRSNLVFSPKSLRQALGSSLFNSSLSCVMSEQEVWEWISVMLKPIQLGKLGQMDVGLGRSHMTLLGFSSTELECLMRWTNGRIRLKIKLNHWWFFLCWFICIQGNGHHKSQLLQCMCNVWSWWGATKVDIVCVLRDVKDVVWKVVLVLWSARCEEGNWHSFVEYGV